MAHKRFKMQKAMAEKLRRNKGRFPCLDSSDALATLLLETFINNNGYLSSKAYYRTKFEVSGKTYSDWIHDLKEAHVLAQYKTDGNRGSDYIRFSAGSLIVEYINAEKTKTKEIPTIDDVPSKAEFEALKADSADLKARMCKIEETVTELKSAMEPPDTAEKQHRRKKAAERLTQLALVKSN